MAITEEGTKELERDRSMRSELVVLLGDYAVKHKIGNEELKSRVNTALSDLTSPVDVVFIDILRLLGKKKLRS